MGWAARARYRQLAGSPCASCAYRPGTPASRDEGDELLARTRKALLEVSAPFFCHDPRYRFEGQRVLCAGHVDAMNALAARGFYDVSDEVRAARVQAARALMRQRDEIYHGHRCAAAIAEAG